MAVPCLQAAACASVRTSLDSRDGRDAGNPWTSAQTPQAGVCRPARAGTQLTLVPIPGCSLRFLEFPNISEPRAGVQEGRGTTGARASTADRGPPRKPEPQKGGALSAPQRPEAGTPATRAGEEGSGQTLWNRAPTADTHALPWEQHRPRAPVHSAPQEQRLPGGGGSI